ncbi:hypothetical protein OAD49_03855 [Flavobacteriaceae bacterium]|nr:hypothetical protein [Flavobacteriaceae bacterium]
MKIYFLYILFIGFFSYNCNSQNSNRLYLPLEVIQYDSNVSSPFSTAELVQLNEVYGASLDKEILSRPNRVLAIKNLLRNRIVIENRSNPKDQKQCTLLSEVSLFDAFVSTLQRDSVFSPQEFNPLKYAFSLYSRGEHMYRVDGTDYFIIIKSQHYNNR